MISAEQFAEWKTHPVTKEIFAEIKNVRDILKDQMAEGLTIGCNAEDTHGKTNKLVGQINGLDQLLNVYFKNDDIEEEVNAQSGY